MESQVFLCFMLPAVSLSATAKSFGDVFLSQMLLRTMDEVKEKKSTFFLFIQRDRYVSSISTTDKIKTCLEFKLLLYLILINIIYNISAPSLT